MDRIDKIILVGFLLMCFIMVPFIIVASVNREKARISRQVLIDKCSDECTGLFEGKDYVCIEKCIELRGIIK